MPISEQTKVQIQVEADLATEAFVIDHALRLVARGAGTFTCELAPGLYKFKFRSGLAITERYHEIPADAIPPIRIKAPAVALSSIAPVRQTRRISNEPMDRRVSNEQLEEAERISSAPALIYGHGSFLFLFLRSGIDQPSAPPVYPTITLHSLAGVQLVILPLPSYTGCAGLLLELDPGAYRLRVDCDGQPLEQIVITSAGWHTQLFLSRGFSGDAGSSILAATSVLMSRSAFCAENASLRYADAARIALSRRSVFMPRELLNELLDDKFENPMLGIYAGHAILSAEEPSLLQRLLPVLERLIPGHPDVLALSLGVSNLPPISVPPMLRRSWTAIINATLDGKAQLQPGSLAARIPTTLLEGTSWLVWPQPDLLPLQQVTLPTDRQLAQLQMLVRLTSNEDIPEQLSLNESEDALYTYLSRRARMNQKVRSSNATSSPLDYQALARVFETTVPNIQATVDRLAAKLSNFTNTGPKA